MVNNGRAARADGVATKIVTALDRLVRGQRSHRQAIAFRHGITPLQLDLLLTLADGPPPEPQVGLLAVELGVTQPTLTDSLNALERKQLIGRQRDDFDRRRIVITLTARGAELVELIAHDTRELVDRIAALPDDEQEPLLAALLALIGHHLDVGMITVARTCLTCRFFEPRPGDAHRCSLLNLELQRRDLRVNCPEHERAGRPAG